MKFVADSEETENSLWDSLVKTAEYNMFFKCVMVLGLLGCGVILLLGMYLYYFILSGFSVEYLIEAGIMIGTGLVGLVIMALPPLVGVALTIRKYGWPLGSKQKS